MQLVEGERTRNKAKEWCQLLENSGVVLAGIIGWADTEGEGHGRRSKPGANCRSTTSVIQRRQSTGPNCVPRLKRKTTQTAAKPESGEGGNEWIRQRQFRGLRRTATREKRKERHGASGRRGKTQNGRIQVRMPRSSRFWRNGS